MWGRLFIYQLHTDYTVVVCMLLSVAESTSSTAFLLLVVFLRLTFKQRTRTIKQLSAWWGNNAVTAIDQEQKLQQRFLEVRVHVQYTGTYLTLLTVVDMVADISMILALPYIIYFFDHNR